MLNEVKKYYLFGKIRSVITFDGDIEIGKVTFAYINENQDIKNNASKFDILCKLDHKNRVVKDFEYFGSRNILMMSRFYYDKTGNCILEYLNHNDGSNTTRKYYYNNKNEVVEERTYHDSLLTKKKLMNYLYNLEGDWISKHIMIVEQEKVVFEETLCRSINYYA